MKLGDAPAHPLSGWLVVARAGLTAVSKALAREAVVDNVTFCPLVTPAVLSVSSFDQYWSVVVQSSPLGTRYIFNAPRPGPAVLPRFLPTSACAMPFEPIGIQITPAVPEDSFECIRIRGLTRENAVPEERLRAYGITAESWAKNIGTGRWPGWVARRAGRLVGYCFGAADTGEVVVLALLAHEEGQGLGKRLLGLTIEDLKEQGHLRLFLGCAADPGVRSHGFYRHLGWKSTGTFDQHGDEVLELHARDAPANAGEG